MWSSRYRQQWDGLSLSAAALSLNADMILSGLNRVRGDEGLKPVASGRSEDVVW
jgi:hypothetical protein